MIAALDCCMKTYLALKNEHKLQLPEAFRGDDVRFTERLVEHFLQEFTKIGDIVFDPFMGYGTTLAVAEAMGRLGFGVEFDEKRWQYAQSILRYPERALHGDSTRLQSLHLPNFDFSITSPPYMGKHHKENPFTAYSTEGRGYEGYLDDLRNIYVQIGQKMNRSAHAIIEVSNLKHEDGRLTTLAWDIAREVSKVLPFVGEVVITWDDTYGYGYDHSYCLVFAKG